MLRTLVPTSRRSFLGLLGGTLGGLTLADMLQLRAQAAEKPHTAVIFVTLGGGPSQHETYDPKPDAPAEYRGSFRAIPTKIAGERFCELLPKQAAIADRLAIIRSVHHRQASHIAEHIVETGYDLLNSANSLKGEAPSVGSVVSKVRGIARSGIPGYVTIPARKAYSGPHWLGAQHQHFAIDDDPNSDSFQVGNLSPQKTLTAARIEDRRELRRQFDALRREADSWRSAEAIDAFSDQAFQLMTGEKARVAFDIAAEDPKTRERYGRNTLGQRMLLARRLVEAGVPFVTVRMFDWDDHDKLAERLSARAPIYDAAITALIEDLGERGLQENVLVVAMGEFGRTPRVNAMAGRDHWPAVNSVVFSGGSYRMGQIIGATDDKGGAVAAAPYGPQNVLGMVYRHLGIDPALTFPDYTGRPRYVLEEREVIRELV